MFTRTQNQVFNRLMSGSQSGMVGGRNVAEFKPNCSNFVECLQELGFSRNLTRCNFQGDVIGTSLWWNESAQLLVCWSGKYWTIATEDAPLMTADFCNPECA